MRKLRPGRHYETDADRRNIRWVAQGVQAVDVWKEIKPLADQAAAAALAAVDLPGPAQPAMEGTFTVDTATGVARIVAALGREAGQVEAAAAAAAGVSS